VGVSYDLQPIGYVRSPLRDRKGAPRQGSEGAPDAWLEMEPAFERALSGIAVGDELVVITWLHGTRLLVGPIEAIDGTPVVDLKPVLGRR